MARTCSVQTVVVQGPEIALSGLAVSPQTQPASGLILALHGGGCSAGYWHCPADDGGLSLLALAAELGFHVLAVDRPGYGASQYFDAARLGLKDQVGFLFDALEAWSRDLAFNGPNFVMGHSIGGILGLLMAADPRSVGLAAVDVLGVPLQFAADAIGAEVQSWSSSGTHIAPITAEMHRSICFGPDGAFGEDALAYDRSLIRPMPVAEYRDAIVTPQAWPAILPTICIPVQITMAENEAMQAVGPAITRQAETLLRNSPNLRIVSQPASGHNASAHHVGRAYHLRALAFFEECIALERSTCGRSPRGAAGADPVR